MHMDHSHVPLYEALRHHSMKQTTSFHVPGHKSRGEVYGDAIQDFEHIVQLDRTELPGLDDLHDPQGAIAQAQQLAADAFGADHTFFLVGGSTAGNIAMILSACQPNDILIVQRDVHQSVIHGLALARARAVFLQPKLHSEHELSQGPRLEDVELALQQYPQAKGVLLNHPSYYGAGYDVKAAANLVHRHDKLLLVDEAHGAHFHFHPNLPTDAMGSGADAAVQSTHKMLGAMTMGAMLHIRGQRLDKSRVQQALSIMQSSSPSYPIMASLDLSRRDAALNGSDKIERMLYNLERLRAKIVQRYTWLGIADSAEYSEYQDPFKLAIYDRSGRLSGFALQEMLQKQGIYAELADSRHVLLAFSPYTREEELHHLLDTWDTIGMGLSKWKQELYSIRKNIYVSGLDVPISKPVLIQAAGALDNYEVRQMSKREAVGKVCADMITPYPPGIPLLYPGEKYTLEVLEALEEIAAQGGRIRGLRDQSLRTFAVRAPHT